MPLPGDLPDPGMNPHLLCLPKLAGGFFNTSATWESTLNIHYAFHASMPLGFFILPVTYHCISSQRPIPIIIQGHFKAPFYAKLSQNSPVNSLFFIGTLLIS